MNIFVFSLLPVLVSAFNFYGSTRPLKYFDPLGFRHAKKKNDANYNSKCTCNYNPINDGAVLQIPYVRLCSVVIP